MGSGVSRVQGRKSNRTPTSHVISSTTNVATPGEMSSTTAPPFIVPFTEQNFLDSVPAEETCYIDAPGAIDEDNPPISAYTAMASSLDLENDELLFNLMYFNRCVDGDSLGRSMDTALEETVAAHSEGNTPYKLRPASAGSLLKLDNHSKLDHEEECVICKESITSDHSTTTFPACHHHFHEECVKRWLELQSWCPTCRTDLRSVAPVKLLKQQEKELEEEKARIDEESTNCLESVLDDDDSSV